MPFSTLLIRLGFVLLILVLLDIYVFSGLRIATSGLSSDKLRKIIHWAYWGISIGYFILICICIFTFNMQTGPKGLAFKIMAIFLVLIWLPKIVFSLFLLAEDIFRIISTITVFVFDKMGWEPKDVQEPYIEGRRKIVSQIGLVVAAIPFASILYGVTKGKYNYTLKEVTLTFKDLPKGFDGLTITQISDIHSGSFDSEEDVKKGIDMINAQKSDIVLFTGDLVNNRADEFYSWAEVFNKIEAPFGKYSSLGNHDYGEYIAWDSEAAKEENFQNLLENHGKMGFKLLRNENIIFTRGADQIALVGVENWGLPPFPQIGDLDKALEGIQDNMFKVLMSHDPSHWDARVLPNRHKVHLTFSGHTHGMQFGIEIPGIIKWSPVKYKYPRWAGLYNVDEQYLYVNRGFGFIGFPGRVGIWPEVTKITLRSA